MTSSDCFALGTRTKRENGATDASVETEVGEKSTSADRFEMPPMDLTESLAEALSRHFVFYFRESRADWTRRVNSARCNAL